ncbi:hypothetical protein [Cupriavidus sp. D39]|nr:hypothetical protein [Cupriavidus sp. D39]MCY0853846.1 hypothetical protein [Cupriavidus sp. D39]
MTTWMRRLARLATLVSALGLTWLSATPAHATPCSDCKSSDGGVRGAP